MTGTVGIVGTGLIGSSLGLALRGRADGIRVVGHDDDPAVAARARERGALDDVADGLSGVAMSDVIVVATPIDAVPATLDELSRVGVAETVVTDVSSVKADVVARGEELFGGDFVGGHPMAGSERHGVEAAEADLFEESWWILTPTERTTSQAYQVVADVAAAAGARPVAVAPGVHDDLVARLSHVPQIVASAVVAAASGATETSLLQLAGNGFRDMTRIAASDPRLWTGIVAANRQGVLEALRALRTTLDEAERVVNNEEWSGLTAWLESARSARAALVAKSHVPADVVALEMIVPDRPGVLAEVTTAAGRRGANIEDLRIIHSTEGGRGRLELLIAGAAAAEGLRRDLENLGHHVHVVAAEL